MYKVTNKDNVFRIRDFTSSDNVDISKFVEGENKRGAPQMQAQVYVLYEDEYNDIETKLNAHESEVQHLKAMIEERETQIVKLKKEIKDNEGANVDEVMQLKEEKFNILQEMSDLEKSHLEEREQLKETHANHVSAIDETHQKEIEKLNEQYNTKLDELNDKLVSEVQANKQSSDNLQGQILAMTQAHNKEMSQAHQDLKDLEIEHANEKIELTKAHQDEVNEVKEELSQVKQDHLKEINEKDKAHSDECEKIRNTFLGLITNENTHDKNEIQEIKKSVPSIFKPFMKKTMKMLEELEEKKQSNTPEKIVKTYELSGEKEKE